MNFQELADTAVDSTIRGFFPEDPGGFEKWDAVLEEAETKIRRLGVSDCASLSTALSALSSERVRLAFESERYNLAATRAAEYAAEFRPECSSYFIVATWRVIALQEINKHEEALEEILRNLVKPELYGYEYIFFLALLPSKAEEALNNRQVLLQKLKAAAGDMLSHGYSSLGTIDFEDLALGEAARRAADEIRKRDGEL